MNDDEFDERPSGFIFGKEFIIVLVIIFSGLSFTLGFFVGKSGTQKPDQALQAQELPPVPLSQAIAPTPVQTQTAVPVQQSVLSPIKDPVSTTASATEKPAVKRSAQNVEPVSAMKNKSVIYTVQIGAFKNIVEAKQLKAIFDKKGYKSFISAGKNKKAQKIFKVKTGEFKEKKEAEVLALKLRKAEGLQTYVTMKTE